MLARLKLVHEAILTGLGELDVLTAEARPPMDRLPALRLRLTRASRARTMLLEQLYDKLSADAPPSQKTAIEALRAGGKDGLVASVNHIGSWSLAEVARRWPEYCAASNSMRMSMRKRIKEEAAVIYPLLANSEAHSGSDVPPISWTRV